MGFIYMKTEQQIKDYIKKVKTYKEEEFKRSNELIIKTLEWVLKDEEPQQLGLF